MWVSPLLLLGTSIALIGPGEERGRPFIDNIGAWEFREFITYNELVDFGFSRSRFTWCNNQQGSTWAWECID